MQTTGNKVFKQREHPSDARTSPESMAGIFGGIAPRPV